MKIALINGRGREGAGVQRFAVELNRILVKQKIEHKFFVCEEKKWGRGNMQEFPDFKSITSKDMIDLEKELNTFDYVFIMAVPSVKHPQDCINNFYDLVKKITTKKIIFQNDHKIASIWRNANFLEMCNLCDGIVSHSITSPFYNKLITQYGEQIKSKFIKLRVGFNFEQLKKYRKENHVKKITYLGRFATFKQPERLFGFLPYARNNNLLLEMKGIERSLGSLPIFYDDIGKKIPKHDIYEVNAKTIANGLEVANEKRDFEHIYIFGPYDYIDGMETLSTALVGADFYHLDADAYGDNFEYAQCEIVGVGTIPMFDYHWAENCWVYENGKKTSKRFLDLENYGLFVKKDLSNVKEIVDKINEINSNKTLKKKYLDCSFEVTRDHCDSEWIFQKLLEDIQTLEKGVVIKSKKAKELF